MRIGVLLTLLLVLLTGVPQADAASKGESPQGMTERVHFVNVGPYMINFFADGKPIYGRLALTLEAKDLAARSALTQSSQRVDSIILPLAMELYAKGRPKPENIRDFKIKSLQALSRQFPNQVLAVYVKTLM
ncbi:MAG: hypothetical protein KJ904_02915 [Alphaproteobacteria bacterium]|nr:hypothetical protein [Alphaproteobacteria bacterium]MBU0797834.1 hypothetical protein [Alphaproteobacteria bacterium]MBU0886088.1 hypothetical protein [Alphaproteobacteria bacterium]MBU1814574.1 hypothetical protein [Alphaproteobacteria bacterium]MBU2091249.1 hypothetical protein [Alphaproteobacteria bacterium]